MMVVLPLPKAPMAAWMDSQGGLRRPYTMTAVVEPAYRSPNSDLATHKFRGQMELEEYGDSVHPFTA